MSKELPRPMIYERICAAMEDIKPIAKDQINQIQRFKFRGIDQVANVLQPILEKHKLFILTEVLESKTEERQTKKGGNLIYRILKIKFTMMTDDGSSVSSVIMGEASDLADKATNKALSVGYKYFLFQLFCIPTEDDPDKDHNENAKNVAKQMPGNDIKTKITAAMQRLGLSVDAMEEIAGAKLDAWGQKEIEIMRKEYAERTKNKE